MTLKRADGLAILIFAIAWLLVISIINPWGDFPVNDDWVYGGAVQNVLRGRFALSAPASANVFLQVYWGALFCSVFGFSYSILRLSTLVAAFGGLSALYGAVREVGAGRPAAIIIVLTLMLDPLYLTMASSFMTDVPFISLTTFALWSFVRGIKRADPRLTAAAFAILFATMLIRQHAMIFIIGFGVALTVRDRMSPRSIALLVAAVLTGLAIQLLYQHWLTANGRTPRLITGSITALLPKFDAGVVARIVVKGTLLFPLLGLMISPVLLLTRSSTIIGRWRAHRTVPAIIFAVLVLFQAALVAGLRLRMPYYGNMLNSYGIGPLTLRDAFILLLNRPAESFFWHWAWLLGLALGIVSSAAVLTEIALVAARIGWSVVQGRLDGREDAWLPTLVATIVILYLALTMVMTFKHNAFDRYLLPLVCPLALIIAYRSAGQVRIKLIGPAFLVACFAAYSIPAVHDYFAFQRARLAATDSLERGGVTPDRIDGGYEYNGRRLEGVNTAKQGLSYWAVGNDYIIALGPLRGYAIAARYAYPRWLTLDRGEVVTLKRTSGTVDPEMAAGVISGETPEKLVPCRLWLAGLPTCPRKLIRPGV